MSNFSDSRKVAALKILVSPIALPLYCLAQGLRHGWNQLVINVRDFPEVIEYIREEVDPAVASVRDRVVAFWNDQVFTRLAALVVLLALPLIALVAIGKLLVDEEFFQDFGQAVVDLATAVWTGEEFY